MSDATPAIVTRSLCFSYVGVAALDSLDFRAEAGEFVALLGSNGSGKTTLMKILLRLLKPHSGEVVIDGKGIGDLTAAELYQRVGMVFQNPSDQLFASTVREDVSFGPRNLKLPETEVAQRVDEALEAVGALELAGRPIHQLSFGEQRRVCLAGVLAMRPGILLLDEPTAGLDPACEAHMVELLGRLNRDGGITVIMATHSVDLVPLLAHRIYVLRGGRLVRQGTAAEIFGDEQTLSTAHLRLPFVSQLFDKNSGVAGAGDGPLPLTVGQGRQRLMELLAAKDARPQAGGAA